MGDQGAPESRAGKTGRREDDYTELILILVSPRERKRQRVITDRKFRVFLSTLTSKSEEDAGTPEPFFRYGLTLDVHIMTA